MIRKITFALMVLILVCSGLLGQCMAQTESKSSGVDTGDYFIFNITSKWRSTDSSATAPVYLADINSTEYYKVMVSSAIGPNVTATNIWHFQNDTETNTFVIMDVETGDMYFMNGFQGFCNANLSIGDLLRPRLEGSPTINETISRNYGSSSRDTNVVTFSYAVSDVANTTEGTETLTLYIDKQTGVFVERNIYTEFPDQAGSETWTLTETNRWTVATNSQLDIPLSTPIIIGIVIVILSTIVVFLIFRNKRKGRKRF